MDQHVFRSRFQDSTRRAIALAREYVVNQLPEAIQYLMLLNQSYDGNPLAPQEQILIKDRRRDQPAAVSADKAVEILWRDGSVPEWINVNVEAADTERTLIALRCCGRFTKSEEFLYHQGEGHPPFHVLGPVMPPHLWRSKSQQKFDLHWRETKAEQQRATLYPEVGKHGSLGRLLKVHVAPHDDGIILRGFEEDGLSSSWATAKRDKRSVQLSLALDQRLFSASFWDRGVQLATLHTADLGSIADKIIAWCGRQVSTIGLASGSKNVLFDADQVAAFDAGPETFTNYRWHVMLKAATESPQNQRLLPAIQEAMQTPALKRLLPYSSMMRLGFSRCTGYPYSGDCPLIGPLREGEQFQVISGNGTAVGQGSPSEAVTMAVQHLPAHCEAAIHGIADDLGV